MDEKLWKEWWEMDEREDENSKWNQMWKKDEKMWRMKDETKRWKRMIKKKIKRWKEWGRGKQRRKHDKKEAGNGNGKTDKGKLPKKGRRKKKEWRNRREIA